MSSDSGASFEDTRGERARADNTLGKKARGRKVSRSGIVDCAIELVAEVGFAEFSVGKVARAYGIRQSHLTYYYRHRDDLIAAMAIRLTERYASRVEQWCTEALDRPGHPIAHIIDELVVDAVIPPTSVLFPAFWEAANQDPNVASALDRIYQGAQRRMVEMLGCDPDDASSQPVRDLVAVLGVSIEGCTAIYGRRTRDPGELDGLKRSLKELLLPAFDRALAASGIERSAYSNKFTLG
jgi:AcrR family transcriptional regulator